MISLLNGIYMIFFVGLSYISPQKQSYIPLQKKLYVKYFVINLRF